MNFDQWKKLNKQQQKEIAKKWDLQKDEGKDIAEAVLKEFIREYGKNKSIQITNQITRMQGDAGWAICVQCLTDFEEKIPENFMGIDVRRYIVDNAEDNPIRKKISTK